MEGFFEPFLQAANGGFAFVEGHVGALAVSQLPAQFKLGHHLAAQDHERLILLRREASRDPVDHTERAQCVVIFGDQRYAGVKADSGFRGD